MRDHNKRSLSKKDQVCSYIIEYGILGLLIFAPLPAASVNKWSLLVIQLVVLVMTGAYFLMRDKPLPNSHLTESLKWPSRLFMGFFLFVGIQMIPWPKFLVRIISPNSYAYGERFASDFQEANFLTLSLIPAHTFHALLAILSYFLFGYLIIKSITKRRQILRIVYILLGMGVFQAIYGLFELYNSNPRILFYTKIHNLDSATGTYVNRNHFSGFLEMVVPLAIGLIIARIGVFSLHGSGWKERLIRLSEKNTSPLVLTIFGTIAMCLGIIFSRSRSGIFIMVFSFFLFFGLVTLFFDADQTKKKLVSIILVVVFVAIALISFQVGISASLERFAMDDLMAEGRNVYWRNTVNLFADYPVLGTGLGTFTSIYPDWEVWGTPIRLYHAHNDYLEYLAELGIVGVMLLLGGVLIILVKSFSAWHSRRNPELKGLGLGGLIAVIGILIHSITDFNLHIPANMLSFSALLALTTVIVYLKKE